jgi:hypothetical protein
MILCYSRWCKKTRRRLGLRCVVNAAVPHPRFQGTTRSVDTVGTVESRTRAPVKSQPMEPQRRSTRFDVQAVPVSDTVSVIPPSRNYYDNLQKQPAEEDENTKEE